VRADSGELASVFFFLKKSMFLNCSFRLGDGDALEEIGLIEASRATPLSDSDLLGETAFAFFFLKESIFVNFSRRLIGAEEEGLID
jgi:hypothetical protein